MKATVLAVIAVSIGLALTVEAQTMVEYSHVATQASKSLAAPAISSRASRNSTGTYAGSTKSVKVWQEKDARLKDVAPSKPTPPALFILSNGERIEANDYVLTVEALRIDQDGNQRTIPMSDVNVDATVAANHQRGVVLKIPTSKSQMMLSF